MNLEKWLKLNIQKKLTQILVAAMGIMIPLGLAGNYLYTKYQIDKFLTTAHKPLLVGLQTGDLVSIQKTLSYLQEDSKILSFEVYDSFSQAVYSKRNNSSSVKKEKSFAAFEFYKDILSSTGQSFGAIKINWSINFQQMVWGLFLIIIAIFVVYLIIRNKLTSLALQIAESINRLPTDVDNGKPSLLFNDIAELNQVYNKLIVAKENIILNENLNSQLKQQESLTKIAQKLAHDIRSPISSLNIIAHKIDNVELKDLQQQVVLRINDIAEELLATAKNNTIKSGTQRVTIEGLCNLIKKEYELQVDSAAIKFHYDEKLKSHEVKNVKVLYPIIKNLINNSVEATDPLLRKIQVRFESTEASGGYQIRVLDNGVGIPEFVQKKLGEEQVSYGKVGVSYSGNGIALWNARKDLAAMNAKLSFFSRPGHNTEFKILVN